MAFLCIIHDLANAQSGTSYINANYFIGNYEGYKMKETIEGKLFPIGLQKIKNVSDHRAWRYGVTMFKQQMSGDYALTESTDNIREEYKIYKVFSPSFQFGQEYQLHLEEHTMFYGGLEIASGIMHNSYDQYSREYNGNQHVSSRLTADGFFWNTHASAQAFLGFRFHVGAMLLGFESGLVNRYTAVLGSDAHVTELWKPQHRLVLGYIQGYNHSATKNYGCRY